MFFLIKDYPLWDKICFSLLRIILLWNKICFSLSLQQIDNLPTENSVSNIKNSVGN